MAKLNSQDVDLSTLDRTYKEKKWAGQRNGVHGGKARYNSEQSDAHNQISEDRNRIAGERFSDWRNIVTDKYRDNYDRIFRNG